ncbi:MAG: DUF4124 domain-containing protein [Myxococcota bacterium]
MRQLIMQMWKTTLLVGVGLTFVLPATAGTLYRWKAADGSVSVTDDPDRIPERYKKAALAFETAGMTGFERHTPTDAVAQAEYEVALYERLARLRELNAGLNAAGNAIVPGSQAPAERPGFEAVVQLNDGTALRVPSKPGLDGPIIVEEVRVRRPGQITTVHDTIVRQGDEILMIVAPDNSHEASPSDITDERVFTGDRR